MAVVKENEMSYPEMYKLISMKVNIDRREKGDSSTINMSDVKDVLYSYSQLVDMLLKEEKVVPLPNLGWFDTKVKKGFEGGEVYAPFHDKETGESGLKTFYKDASGDCLFPKFNLSPTYRKRFKKDTEQEI